ncbi:MAG: hypothetical protein WD077_11065 [Bacteroidia bacterium]
MRLLLILFFVFITSQLWAAKPLSSQIRAKEVLVPTYQMGTTEHEVVLRMSYARPEIHNPKAWQNDDKQKVVYEIDLVFTRYPHKKMDWITNYDTLLEDRLKAIQALDPTLVRNRFIRWNFVLQTSCETEPKAMQMFHGVVFKYFLRDDMKRVPGERKDMTEARDIAYGYRPMRDSTAFHVFSRNSQWKDMVVVSDWTGSMYQYGSQILSWHRINEKSSGIKSFMFFNDGDKMPDYEKRNMKMVGGIYTSQGTTVDAVLETMATVMKNGDGGDSPENDMEALLKAVENNKDAGEIVLIADNNSSVRDIYLVKKMNRPVRIILCGTKGRFIHPDYMTLAYFTNGSIHTIDRDLNELHVLAQGENVRYGGYKYVLQSGKILMLRD